MSTNLMKINKPIRVIRSIIQKCIDVSAGSNRAELQSWLKNPNTLEKFHKNIKKEQEVCTLLFPESPKKISQFFYPLKLQSIEMQTLISLEDLNKIDLPHLLVNGRLGQGKSMLLRYLQFIELNSGRSLPIIVELRKVKNASELIDAARLNLVNLGLDCSTKLFDFLLTNSFISLMYDGFDEVPLEFRNDFNEKIKIACQKYDKTKIIVTSREGTEASLNSSLKAFNICLLKEKDIAPFIKTIISDVNTHKPILAKINESKDFDYSVLDTPLLITWFIIVYNKRLKIPKTKLGFYEDLFVAILTRHDGMKESHNRATKSKLSDDDIKSVFCTLCYLVRDAQAKILSSEQILKFITRSLNICDFKSVKASDYLYDLTNVTCLLKKDGIDYHFIHESIVQYFSACFVKETIEENAKKFYTNRVNDWKKREGELQFLKDIDEIRYLKYFYLPSIDLFLKKEGKTIARKVFHDSIAGFVEIDNELNFVIVIIKDGDYYISKSFDNFDLPIRKSANKIAGALFNHADKDIRKKLIERIYQSGMHFLRFRYIGLYEMLSIIKKVEAFESSIQNEITDQTSIMTANSKMRIEKEQDKEDLFA